MTDCIKKAASLILALALCASLALPAFAADTPTDEVEPNDLTSESQVITERDVLIHGTLSLTAERKVELGWEDYQDIDQYVFVLLEPTEVLIWLMPMDQPNDDFLILGIMDGDGNRVRGDSFYSDENSAWIYYFSDTLEAGFYYINVLTQDVANGSKYNGANYLLSYTETPANGADEGAAEQPAETPAETPSTTTAVPAAKPAIALSPQKLAVNGATRSPEIYNIGNTNFFGLRALRPYLGYEVGYDGDTNTAIITTK